MELVLEPWKRRAQTLAAHEAMAQAMDSDTFEALIEKLSAAAYRRDAVKGLIGGALASVSAISITSAKGGKHKGKGRDGKNRHGRNGRNGGKGKDGGNGQDRKHHGNGGGNGQARKGGAARRKKQDPAQDSNGVQSQSKKRCKKNGKNCSRQQSISAL